MEEARVCPSPALVGPLSARLSDVIRAVSSLTTSDCTSEDVRVCVRVM